MSHESSFELLEVRPVSPINYRPYSWEEYQPVSPQPSPYQRPPPLKSKNKSELTDICLTNEGTMENPSLRCKAKASMYESENLISDTESGNFSIQYERSHKIRGSSIENKMQKLLPHCVLALGTVIISLFSIIYSYKVLVSHDAVPKSFAITPGQTVLVVNILSHMAAFMCWALFSNATEALRWALACREKGVLITSFLALSQATPLGGIAYLCMVRGYHQIWSFQRFISIIIITILGLVLITDVTFKNIYTSSSGNQPLKVIAGLAPLNSSYLFYAPENLASLYITAYNMGFMTDPKFVVSVPPISCTAGPNCTSLFLPGGLELVRLQGNDSTATLFGQDLPGDYTTIVTENAPGFHLEFSSLGRGFVFDPSVCTTYGESIGDGIYICLAKDGPTMVAGWSVCPTSVKDSQACSTNTTWRNSAYWSFQVSLFERVATVAYDGVNNSIVSIESIGSPKVVPIEPSDFERYHSLALGNIPKVLNTSDAHFSGAANSYTAQFAMTWLLRLYQDQFKTYQNGGLDLLKGLLAVSIQFNTLMWLSLNFDTLPDNMKTTATLQKVSYRAIIQPWTVWVFGGLAFTILSWSIGCLFWVWVYGPNSPNTSMFPEVNIASKSSAHNLPKRILDHHIVDTSEETLKDLGRLTRMTGLGNGMSGDAISAIRGKRIRCGSYQAGKDTNEIILIVTDQDMNKVHILEEGVDYA